jgi:hypothetical protein
MGFRFMCEHCGSEAFQVYWDITMRGMIPEQTINLKCEKCKVEYALIPEIQWDLRDMTHATVVYINDRGEPIEIPIAKAEKVLQENKDESKPTP